MKDILFISPDLFGYYKAISAAISRSGRNPIWLNQLPATNVASRVLFRLAPGIASRFATGHFSRELSKIGDVEQILIIKGEGVSKATIAEMRTRFPKARIVFYLWDSLVNTPGAEEKYKLCDAAFSFDLRDCDSRLDLNHLPLFHSKSEQETSIKPGFAAFVGTLHSNRYPLIQSLGEEIEKITGIAPFLYFHYPNRWLFKVLKVLKKSFRMVSEDELHFVPLPRDQFLKIDAEAQIAIDITHPKQSGLTMRTIEALGSGKKLITNNKTVQRYDFYTPENCYVTKDRDRAGLVDFLESNYQTPPRDLVEKYHIDSWLRMLLDIEPGSYSASKYLSENGQAEAS